MSKLQRQMLIWIIGIFLLSLAVNYFGYIAMWGLGILLVWSMVDAKFESKLEQKYEEGKEDVKPLLAFFNNLFKSKEK